MIVDSSAVVAILQSEPGWEVLERALSDAAGPVMSAATYLETSIVIDRRGSAALSRLFDQMLKAWNIEIVPVSAHQAELARAAHRDFGRGSGHPARLNYGDCFSYALAADRREPLLFVGEDFVHTDIVPAV